MSGFSLATSSLVIGRAMTLAEDLPEWLEQGTESSLRDTEDDMRPPGPAQIPAPRSIASMSRGPTPVILTPTRVDSPTATGSSPAPWTDLDKFYADNDDPTESDGGGDGSDDGDDGGDTSGTSEDDESTSGDGETASDSEGSTK
jgi:AP-3 complex subunit beta